MPESHLLLQGPPAHLATGSVFVPGPRGVRTVRGGETGGRRQGSLGTSFMDGFLLEP